MLDAYLFDVSRATTATTLLTCRTDVLADDCLDAEEKAEVCAVIEKRFAALNAGLLGNRERTRLKHSDRIPHSPIRNS